MVPLLLLFGEVTPKTIAVSNPIRYSTRIVAVPLALWINLIGCTGTYTLQKTGSNALDIRVSFSVVSRQLIHRMR